MEFHGHYVHIDDMRSLELELHLGPSLADPAVVRGLESDLAKVADDSAGKVGPDS